MYPYAGQRADEPGAHVSVVARGSATQYLSTNLQTLIQVRSSLLMSRGDWWYSRLLPSDLDQIQFTRRHYPPTTVRTRTSLRLSKAIRLSSSTDLKWIGGKPNVTVSCSSCLLHTWKRPRVSAFLFFFCAIVPPPSSLVACHRTVHLYSVSLIPNTQKNWSCLAPQTFFQIPI